MVNRFTDQELASMEGPRALKDPGTVEWSWQTVSALQHMWQSLHLNYEHYMTILSEAEEHQIWEKIPPDAPYGSKENMLLQVEVGDARDAQKRMKVQTLAAQARALKKYGGEKKQDNDQGSLDYPGRVSDRASRYLLARIARDHPDVMQRVMEGEFDSVRAAAREAGIALAAPKKTLSLGNNVERVADTLRNHYEPEQISRLIERLSMDVASSDA